MYFCFSNAALRRAGVGSFVFCLGFLVSYLTLALAWEIASHRATHGNVRVTELIFCSPARLPPAGPLEKVPPSCQ